MKYLRSVCVLIMLIVVTAGLDAGLLQAQPNVLPPDDLMLRIEEDDQWMFTGAEGDKNFNERFQVIDGEPQIQLHPANEAFLKEHNVQSIYVFSSEIRPVNNVYDKLSTGVEVKLLSFNNATDAAAYQNNYFQSVYQVDQADNDGKQQGQLFDSLPESTHPTVGWTFQTSYMGSDGQTIGDASAIRLSAQSDLQVLTVRVRGPFVDFNFDLASAMLAQQLECVAQNVVCEALTITDLTPAWQYAADGILYYINDANESTKARFVFPVEEPVRAPEMGTVFEAGPVSNESASDTGTVTRTTRTSRSGDSAGSTRVVRTTRTSTSSNPTGTTRTTRTARMSTASTSAEPANATVIAESADVFADPDANADVLVTLAEGDRITITGEPQRVGSVMWVPVVTGSGETGWMLIQDVWKD